MAKAQIRMILLITAAAGMLSACVDGLGTTASVGTTSSAKAGSTRIVTRDIEAPEVFQTTAVAQWDGRPSLGGVWIAAPRITDPERVIIRNPANGKFVIGTLFRRAAAGDGLQLSSDAAQALDIKAATAVTLDVTALRRADGSGAVDPSRPLLDSAEAVGRGPADDFAAASLAAAQDAQRLQIPATPVLGTTRPTGTAAVGAQNARATAPTAAATAKTASGGMAIQLGIFSLEANAQRARQLAQKAGLAADIKRETSQGKALWSVSARGSAADLTKVKALGFPDAYFLKR